MLLLTGWGLGLVAYADNFPKTVAEPHEATDAVVVLTGGSGRLETGLTLLKNNRAAVLFVSGVYQGVDVNALITLVQENPETLSSRIEIGNATDTRGNAEETAVWAAARNIDSIRLVTASYHMPRSLLEFRHRLPNVKIFQHPVFPDSVKNEWWLWPGTAALFIKEYNKYLLAWCRQWLETLTNLRITATTDSSEE